MENRFKDVINNGIKPLLKQAGFKKKALNFYKSVNDIVYILNIQKSHGNSSQELRFYINIGIHDNTVEEEINNRVLEFPKEYQCHVRLRIDNEEVDFTINSTSDDDVLIETLTRLIEQILQFFDDIPNHEAFLEYIAKEGTLKEDELFRYFIRKNLQEHANSMVKYYKKAFSKNDDRWEDVFKEMFADIVEEENSPIQIPELQ